MKQSLISIMLFAISSVSLASSGVIFPIKHKEIKPYPNQAEIVLNGPTGMHNGVSYTITCELSNPSSEEILTETSFEPHVYCENMGGCGTLTLNSQHSGKMLHLKPGMNTFVRTKVMTSSFELNTKLVFKNYDNDYSIFVENCNAALE